jgi:carbon monoxide dehydrogenase subunit G
VELEHRFELPVGVDKAFASLLDLELVGPCFPGASVDSINGDEFSGSVKVKIGPIPLNYRGTARFVERDFANHTAVIEANGSAPRSGSTATMLVNASATAVAPNRTSVVLVTTLAITGRAANFGRQAMIDVGNELIGKFADCVSNKLAGKTMGGATLLGVVNPDEVAAEVTSGAVAEDAAPAAHRAPPATLSAIKQRREQRRAAAAAPNKPVQVLQTPLVKQLIPVIVGGALALLILLKKSKPKELTEKDLAKRHLKAVKKAEKRAKRDVKSAKEIVSVADDEQVVAVE